MSTYGAPALATRRLFPGSTTVAALVGAATAGAQVVLLRELVIAAGGNELAAALALTSWMLGTAAGSALGGLMARSILRRRTAIRAWVWAGLCAVVLLVPLALPVVGWARQILGPGVGEVVGLHQALGIALLTLIPPSLFIGLLYPVTCRLAEREGRSAGDAAGRVFGIEALTFGAAGAFTALVLVPRVPPGVILLILAGALTVTAVLVALGGGRRWILWAPVPVLLWIGVATMVPPHPDRAELYGRRPVLVLDTVRSRIEVVRDGGQADVYLDGLWSFAVPDQERAERTVHPAMLQHAEPKVVLLVGGAVGGALAEVLRYPSVEQVDVIESEPGLIEAARDMLPSDGLDLLDDPRVTLHLGDGRAFVRTTHRVYDVIVLALPDPRSAQLNRFYTVEYFRELEAVMGDFSVLGLSAAGSPDMLGPAQARYVATFRATLRQVFGDVVAYPGDRVAFVCSWTDGVLTTDSRALGQRLGDRSVATRYLTSQAIAVEWGPLRRQYLDDVLDQADTGQVNRDLEPLCFYQDTVLWTTAHAPRFGAAYERLGGLRVWWFVVAVVVAAAALVVATRRGPWVARARAAAIPSAVAVTGATGIALEVVVILGYQVAYGNLLTRLGVVIAAYMLGMAGGAWLLTSGRIRASLRTLTVVQFALALTCGILWAVAEVVGIDGMAPWLEPVFAVVTAAVGCAAGIHFPCAVHVRAAAGQGRGAGGLYALDLAASALASLVLAAFAIPILGVPAVLVLLVLVNLGATALLVAGGSAPMGNDGTLAIFRER